MNKSPPEFAMETRQYHVFVWLGWNENSIETKRKSAKWWLWFHCGACVWVSRPRKGLKCSFSNKDRFQITFFFSCRLENEDNTRFYFFSFRIFSSPALRFFSIFSYAWSDENVFQFIRKISVEFRLNDRNSTLKLNVSQTIFEYAEVGGAQAHTWNIGRHGFFHSPECEILLNGPAKCKSGNLMTCRGLIRLVAPSLLLSIHILHLFTSLGLFGCHWPVLRANGMSNLYCIFLWHMTRPSHICWKIKWKWRMFWTKWREKKTHTHVKLNIRDQKEYMPRVYGKYEAVHVYAMAPSFCLIND